MKKKRYVLGVDGGGTKTAMVLATDTSRVLATVKTGPSNLHSNTRAEIKKEIRQGMRSLLKRAKLPLNTKLSAMAAGLSGLDSHKDFLVARKIFHDALDGKLPRSERVQIVNDTIIGFWSGTESQEGLCVIGGTGSNCYGRTKRGKEAWASGRGHILADEGSGYDLGIHALKAAVKSADGRGPKSTLQQHVFKHYDVKNLDELISRVYYKPFGKQDIAGLALCVQNAAYAGDKVAQKIARNGADELVLMAKTVAKKLGFDRNLAFDIVMIGGVIQRDPYVTRRFKTQIKKSYPNANFIIPSEKPVMGAVRLALSTL